VTHKGIRWLRARADDARPFFLWLHYFDPHALYLRHPEHSSELRGNRAIDRYDQEIAFTDHWIGTLLNELDALGLAAETAVVLFADHGEEFADHGAESHGHTLHGELTHIPLVIRIPGWQPRRVPDAVSSLDIMPTVLELLGVEPPGPMAGQSLVELMRGVASPPRPILSELKREKPGWVFDSLELGRWKLIVDRVSNRKLLYDVQADPAEQRDLSAEHPEVVERLDAERMRLLETAVRSSAATHGVVELSAPERESLEALGYVE
jgi:choline-sulfatase